MAKVKLHAGAEIDILSRAELGAELDRAAKLWREYAYGLKHMSLPVLRGVPASGSLTLGGTAPDQVWCGPRQGYVWRITRVTVVGLATGDTVTVYKGDPRPESTVTVLTAAAPTITPGHGLVLKPGDCLTLTGSSLTAANVALVGEALEAPATMIYKLIGG